MNWENVNWQNWKKTQIEKLVLRLAPNEDPPKPPINFLQNIFAKNANLKEFKKSINRHFCVKKKILESQIPSPANIPHRQFAFDTESAVLSIPSITPVSDDDGDDGDDGDDSDDDDDGDDGDDDLSIPSITPVTDLLRPNYGQFSRRILIKLF